MLKLKLVVRTPGHDEETSVVWYTPNVLFKRGKIFIFVDYNEYEVYLLENVVSWDITST